MLAMTKQNKWILYGVMLLLFIGISAAEMTSCILDRQRADNQHAQSAYEEIKKDYDVGKYEDAQKQLDKLKSQYKDSEYTKNAMADFKDIPDKIKAKKEQEQQAAEAKRQADAPKLQKVVDGYNNALSNNDYKILYAGMEVKGNHVIIYVTNYWNVASKDVKIAYIKQCAIAWEGWHRSYNVDCNLSNWNFDFINKASGRKVATWGSVRGPVLKD